MVIMRRYSFVRFHLQISESFQIKNLIEIHTVLGLGLIYIGQMRRCQNSALFKSFFNYVQKIQIQIAAYFDCNGHLNIAFRASFAAYTNVSWS